MFTYFGYGSNLDQVAMRAKGIVPVSSRVGELAGWRLRFNVAHFFRHEGGVANIERTGHADDRVLGVLHECDDDALALLDVAELYPIGYDRVPVEVSVVAEPGSAVRAVTYVGTPAFVDDSVRPSQRYLDIVVRGARTAGLDPEYVAALAATPVHRPPPPPSFVPPAPIGGKEWPVHRLDDLAGHPHLTGLAGHVFDMSGARAEHRLVREWFGGRDMTVTLLHRMASSDATESLADVVDGRLDDRQIEYLDGYLEQYLAEYDYAGRVDYRPR